MKQNDLNFYFASKDPQYFLKFEAVFENNKDVLQMHTYMYSIQLLSIKRSVNNILKASEDNFNALQVTKNIA